MTLREPISLNTTMLTIIALYLSGASYMNDNYISNLQPVLQAYHWYQRRQLLYFCGIERSQCMSISVEVAYAGSDFWKKAYKKTSCIEFLNYAHICETCPHDLKLNYEVRNEKRNSLLERGQLNAQKCKDVHTWDEIGLAYERINTCAFSSWSRAGAQAGANLPKAD